MLPRTLRSNSFINWVMYSAMAESLLEVFFNKARAITRLF